MKKILLLFIIVTVSLSLIGCTNKIEYQPVNKELSEEIEEDMIDKNEINYHPEYYDLSEVIADFKLVENGKIKIIRTNLNSSYEVNITLGIEFSYIDVLNQYLEKSSAGAILMYKQLADGSWVMYEYYNSSTNDTVKVSAVIDSKKIFYDYEDNYIEGDFYVVPSIVRDDVFLKIRINNDGMIDYIYEYRIEGDDEIISEEYYYKDLNVTTLNLPEAVYVEYYFIKIDNLISQGAEVVELEVGVFEVTMNERVFILNLSESKTFILVTNGNKTLKTYEYNEYFIQTDDGEFIEENLDVTQISNYIAFEFLREIYIILGEVNSYHNLIRLGLID